MKTLIYAACMGLAIYFAMVKIGTGLVSDVRTTMQSTNALIKDAQASLDDNYFDAKATMETVATTAKDTDDFIRDLVTGMRSDVDRLTDSADTDARALDADLQRIGKLTEDLDGKLRSGAATAKQTATDLQAALGDLDKLIADPNLKSILTTSAKTSEHLAESAESVDIALRPWRKKASQLKMIVEKALGLIKIVIPL